MLRSRYVALVCIMVISRVEVRAQDLGGWLEPDDGWDYVFEANEGEDVDGEFDFEFANGLSLDGTWTHSNGSDAWDGSGPGDEFRPDGVSAAAPGGAGIILLEDLAEDGGEAEVLSIVDTGDPRSRGFSDPSNRKMWFCHDVGEDAQFCDSCLQTGMTFIIRSRLHPDVDPLSPGWQLPDGGVDNDAGQGAAPGYALRDGGKGGHGFYDSALDRNFSMTPHGETGYQLPPQVGEGLPPANFLDVGDNTQFHAMWVTVEDDDLDDRFTVTIYLDGATEPTAVFEDIQLGDDTDCDGISHMHMGFHSTPQIGGVQVDYFGYKIGVFEPSSTCPGGFVATLDPESGAVDLSWSRGDVESYTLMRNGEVLTEGLGADTISFSDDNPVRPAATYELVAIVGGAPVDDCNVNEVSVTTVVCPELTCSTDPAAGTVTLKWTEPGFFSATGYALLRGGVDVGSAAGDATSFTDSPVPGLHTYELVVESDTEGACEINTFCEISLVGGGAIDIAGDTWNQTVANGVAQLVTTTDGALSVYFPAGAKTAADTLGIAVMVSDLGPGGLAQDGRYRVEIQARYSNEVRIVNRSADPESYVHFDLARTGVSSATDENGEQDTVGQVPDPPGGATVDSASSTIINTESVGLSLVPGLNIIEIIPVDLGGLPHADQIQLFALRIGSFAEGLDSEIVEFPCPTSLSCTRSEDCAAETATVELNWRSGDPHAYELERDGEVIAKIPMGDTTSFVDDPGLGSFTYTLRITDDDSCPAMVCQVDNGVPSLDGLIQDWLVLGPIDWGCALGCANPGEDAIVQDYLAGTSGGQDVDQETIQPFEGMTIELSGTSVLDTGRADINPDRPGTATWFAQTVRGGVVDANLMFGGSPGNNFMIYAVAYVRNDTGDQLPVSIDVTSDDSVEVFLGDESVWVNNIARGIGPVDTVFDLTLEPGINRVMVKTFQGAGGVGWALAFTDEIGLRMTDLEVTLCPDEAPPPRDQFVRGDHDASGAVNITDGIFVLNFLFLGGPDPSCKDSADADDSGAINITDGIYVLNFLFLGGPNPPAPYPNCGPDTSEDRLDCLEFDPCG